MFNPAVPQGTFTRSFVKGAGSGALMMGIFSGLNFTATAVGVTGLWGGAVGLTAAVAALPAMLGIISVGMVATGLFSGIIGTQRAAESATAANTVSHTASRAPVRAPEQAVAPAMDQAVHNSRAWTQRVSAERSGGQTRVSEILANGSLSDRDRAAAILSAREQSSALEGRG